MFDGFLGTRASFMFDVVSLAMLAVVPVLAYSVHLAKRKKNYALHKRIQVALGVVLLIAVVLFEVDVRLHPWAERAKASPYFGGILQPVLWVHLFFSVSTSILWIATLTLGLRHFPAPPAPGAHSPLHLKLAKPAALFMYCTAVTGWTFYYLAFVAT